MCPEPGSEAPGWVVRVSAGDRGLTVLAFPYWASADTVRLWSQRYARLGFGVDGVTVARLTDSARLLD